MRIKTDDTGLIDLLEPFFRRDTREKAARILMNLRRHEMGTNQLARVCGISPSTVSDILKKLEMLGFVEQDFRASPWRLSSRFIRNMERIMLAWRRFIREQNTD